MGQFDLKQEISSNLKQSQNLILSLAMRQAFLVLQMPIVELAEWLKIQIEQNPILESDNNTEEPNLTTVETDEESSSERQKRRSYQETLWRYRPSLFEHLMQQAQLAFTDPEELNIAEILIGSLDERGFLQELPSLPGARRILETIQTFDPQGIAARSPQESLLIQLRLRHKENRLAYRLIQEHFDDLLHGRLARLEKKLKCTRQEISHEISCHIAPLDPHPGSRFSSYLAPQITPDLIFSKGPLGWKIEINHAGLPSFQVASSYHRFLSEKHSAETRYVKRQLASARWLTRTIHQRSDTLRAIAEAILRRQGPFLSADSRSLVPMSIQEIAKEVSLSESTVARAIAHKYCDTPVGLFALRSLFSHTATHQNGRAISSHALHQQLQGILKKEDKARPLSDAALARRLQEIGYPCARRTIAKYRKHLAIPSASRRRHGL